jgi:hypothetical protein
MECGGTCVNLDSDQNNCGACGNACGATAVCTAGACVPVDTGPVCPTGLTQCGSVCKDTQTDEDNCGTCGTACGPAASCTAGVCVTEIWDVLATLDGTGTVMMTDFTPTGGTTIYGNNNAGTWQSYTLPTTADPDGVWATLAAPPVGFATYDVPAWIGNAIYMIHSASLYKYDIAGNTWTTEIDNTLTHTTNDAQGTADDTGNLYVWTGDQYLMIIKTSDNTATYVQGPTEIPTTEPRAAWDSLSKRVYLGDYDDPTGAFYAYDPAAGTFTALAPFPLDIGFGDGFCSDRAGHVFATSSGDIDGGDVWMYTASTNAWVQLPWLPSLHGSSSSCTVANGYLYVSNGDSYEFARLKL